MFERGQHNAFSPNHPSANMRPWYDAVIETMDNMTSTPDTPAEDGRRG